MFTRILIVMIAGMLAVPGLPETRPADTSQAPWGEVALAAKGSNHKKEKKHHGKERKDKEADAPQFTTEPLVTTVTRTIRQPLTQTFTNAGPITIPTGAPGTTSGPANPYPATIAVTGFVNGTITDVNLILTDLTHQHHDDLDILLSSEDGRRALVMSDAGDLDVVPDVDLVLDDEAAAALPKKDLLSGTYRPTNFEVNADTFTAPAPVPDGNLALSIFDGANPNGMWQLWVMDNGAGDHGDLGGWALQISAEVDVEVQEQLVVPQDLPAPNEHDAQAPGNQDSAKEKKGKKWKRGKHGKN